MPDPISPVHPDSRILFLERVVPKWAWPYTCRCRREYPQDFDIERQMYVCQNCRLPEGFELDNRQSKKLNTCISCGTDFIVWIQNKLNQTALDQMCEQCNGTNAAKKGQRTIDPNANEEY